MDCGREVYGRELTVSSSVVSAGTGHRVRWVVIWTLVVAWFAALALNIGGNGAHLLLLIAIGLLVYELLIPEQT